MPNALAINKGHRKGVIGKNATIPKTLNKKWHNASRNAFSLLDKRAVKMLVVVVPKFAPNVRGNALSRLIMLVLTRGTKAEVRIELDWTTAVTAAPSKMQIYPLRYGSNGRSFEKNLADSPASGMEINLFIIFTKKM